LRAYRLTSCPFGARLAAENVALHRLEIAPPLLCQPSKKGLNLSLDCPCLLRDMELPVPILAICEEDCLSMSWLSIRRTVHPYPDCPCLPVSFCLSLSTWCHGASCPCPGSLLGGLSIHILTVPVYLSLSACPCLPGVMELLVPVPALC
jgi:hypothetical protein